MIVILNCFVKNKTPTKGATPVLETYINQHNEPARRTPSSSRTVSRSTSPNRAKTPQSVSVNVNDNQDFSINKMSNAMDEIHEEQPIANSLFAKYYKDRNRGFKNEDFKRD